MRGGGGRGREEREDIKRRNDKTHNNICYIYLNIFKTHSTAVREFCTFRLISERCCK